MLHSVSATMRRRGHMALVGIASRRGVALHSTKSNPTNHHRCHAVSRTTHAVSRVKSNGIAHQHRARASCLFGRQPRARMQVADESFDCESSSDEDDSVKSPSAAEHQMNDIMPPSAAVEAEDEEDDSEEEEEDVDEDEQEAEEKEVAAAVDSTPGDDDTPNWLMEACDVVGVEKPSTGHQTPPLEQDNQKPMSLRERLAAVKATKGVVEKTKVARKVEFVAAVDENAYLREEVTKLRRESRLQAQYIETLKQKNEVLEQRLALREEFDTM